MNFDYKFDIRKEKLYFASDYHFDHKASFITEMRNFQSYADNSEYILHSLKTNIDHDERRNVLIYLGDFSLNSTVKRTIQFLYQVIDMGQFEKIIYISGNHESYIDKIRKAINMARVGIDSHDIPERDAWRSAINLAITPESGEMAHSTIEESELYQQLKGLDNIIEFAPRICNIKYDGKKIVCCHFPIQSWEKSWGGSYMIHGHTHGSLESNYSTNTQSKILDVSVDVTMSIFQQSFANWSNIKGFMVEKV